MSTKTTGQPDPAQRPGRGTAHRRLRMLTLILASAASLAVAACVLEGAGEIRSLGYEYSPSEGVTLLLPRCDDPREPDVLQVVTEDSGEVAVLERGDGWTLERGDALVWRVAVSQPLPVNEPLSAIVLDGDGLETWYAPLLLDEAVGSGPTEVLDDDRTLTRRSVTTQELTDRGCPSV